MKGTIEPKATKKDFKVTKKPNILDKDIRLKPSKGMSENDTNSSADTTTTDGTGGKEASTAAVAAVKAELSAVMVS